MLHQTIYQTGPAMTDLLQGVLTALATPFDSDGNVDDQLLGDLVDRSVNAGVGGVVAGGGTGEVASLSQDERRHLFETVVNRTAGRVPVIANTGALTAQSATLLSRAAQAAGADAVMMCAPFYETLSEREITHYFTTVAASVDLPVMLYNNPSTTGVNLSAHTLAQLGRDIENVAWVKDSSKDWEQALRLIHHHNDDIGLIVGWDSFLFSALLEGATGVMAGAANVVPDEIMAVARAVREGRFDQAHAAWTRVFPVIDALLALPFPQAVKAGLALRGHPIGEAREPLLGLAQDDLRTLARAMNHLQESADPTGHDQANHTERITPDQGEVHDA